MKFKNALLIAGSLVVAIGAGRPALARDQALLGQALEMSTQERGSVEKHFKGSDSSARKPERDSLRAISLEIGDGLGSSGGGGRDDSFEKAVDHRAFREKGVDKKLDREWKDVNKSFKKVESPGANSQTGRAS